MAEAMLLGTPVIATNWSANTEFMNEEVACMVDYTLVELEKDYGPFKKGQRWAQPKLEQVVDFMKLLYGNPEKRKEYSLQGKKMLESSLGLEITSNKIKERMKEIV